MPKLFTTAYFPPVSCFALMAQEMGGLIKRRDDDNPLELSPSVVYIEACENYQKQSYRNRCCFYAADGVQALSFPIMHEGGTHKLPVNEIKVDYSVPWLQQHKRAIVSAYRTSAYFEYYQDELFGILDSRPATLLELNTLLLRFCIEKTGLDIDLRFTSAYTPPARLHSSDGRSSEDLLHSGGVGSAVGLVSVADGNDIVLCEDFRERIHPKRPNDILSHLNLDKTYFQVFAMKYGFKSDLSVLDLLFNEGPDSILYLKNL